MLHLPIHGTGDDDQQEPVYYMVVGFEVSPCSIKRVPGKPVEELSCGYEDEKRFEAQVRGRAWRACAGPVFQAPYLC
jgi:hypothetical protein